MTLPSTIFPSFSSTWAIKAFPLWFLHLQVCNRTQNVSRKTLRQPRVWWNTAVGNGPIHFALPPHPNRSSSLPRRFQASLQSGLWSPNLFILMLPQFVDCVIRTGFEVCAYWLTTGWICSYTIMLSCIAGMKFFILTDPHSQGADLFLNCVYRVRS